MNSALPFALIIGIDHFAAKKLAEELSNKDINVVGVGEYVAGLSEIKNFQLLVDLSEVSGRFSYVFDFVGDKSLWEMEQFKGDKITLICVNDKEKAKQISGDLDSLNLNWRMVEAEGVYGPGMDEDNFLAEAIKLAVVNKNLILPDLRNKFRILSIEDLVEAILRASFLSGTEKEKFLILGKETNSEEIAKVLIDEAKMTRYKVLQKEIEIEKIDEERLRESVKKLRWEAKNSFKEGITETLQYFFSRADEENRKKKMNKPTIQNPSKSPFDLKGDLEETEKEDVKKEKNERRMEVVVEEPSFAPEEFQTDVNEIENFYKQKKTEMEVEVNKPSVPPVWNTSLDREAVKEEFDDDFEEKSSVGQNPSKSPFDLKGDFKTDQNVGQSLSKFTFPPGVETVIKTGSDMSDPYKQNLLIGQNPSKSPFDLKGDFKKNKKKFKKIKWKIYLAVLVVLLLITPIRWLTTTILAVKSIEQNLTLLESKKYSKMENSIDKNLIRINEIDQEINDWGLNKFELIRNYQSLLKIGEDVLGLEKDIIPISQSADLISQAIFKEKEINFSDEIKKEEDYLINFENKIGLVLARLNGDFSWIPAKWRISLQKEALEMKKIKEKINLISKGIKIFPEMLGLDGIQRDYLVLLQNEMELRATGGFIGSYGILSFKNGKLLDFKVHDVYDADGQLKGHVEPPIEIKDYLGEANWYMRDANWNPNFVKSAADVQWFLGEEMNQKVNGVIGVNLTVAKAIVEVIGEIKVTDFKETITKDNLYEQAEYYSESKFFPGSTQKASFLGSLGNQMFNEIKELKIKQQLTLISSVVDLLEENEIQLAFNDSEIAKITNDLGWSGTIYQGKCTEENCFSDYLMVVDSNFGVNKANYFVSKNIEQTVNISENSVERILKINYENTSRNNDFPGGIYKNYLRLYLPNDINLEQISFGGVIYSNDKIRIKESDGKKEIGFLVEIPVASKKTVEIKYSSVNNLEGKNKFSYIGYIQKQSGFGDVGLTTLVSFPNDWQPLQVEPQASMVGGKLLFSQKLNKDIKMGVQFGK